MSLGLAHLWTPCHKGPHRQAVGLYYIIAITNRCLSFDADRVEVLLSTSTGHVLLEVSDRTHEAHAVS